MPPLITVNSPLGNAFGGKIATLNYNYQPNASPSTATITVISENNKFIEPELLSDFTIPNLGIRMKIVEVQYNDDSNYKTLQIELQDTMSYFLDKEILFVRGIHSSGVAGDITNGNWINYPSANLPILAQINRNRLYSQVVSTGINKIRGGVLIGRLRSTLTFETGEEDRLGRIAEFASGKPQTAIYENGKLIYRDDIKDYEKKLEEGRFSTQNAWGYTIGDFFSALAFLGLKVNGPKSLNNELLFFTDSGTLRSVLNSILGKLGLTYYVDPFNNSINLVDNNLITTINKNIKNLYLGNIQSQGATSLNVKKSVKDVAGRHFVVKTSPLDPSPLKGGAQDPNRPNDKPRIRTTEFKRVFYNKSETPIIDRREKEFISRVAYLYSAGIDESLITNYIFALGKKYDPTNWSDYGEKAVYGGKKGEETDLDKTSSIAYDPSGQGPSAWQVLIENNPVANFDMNNLASAYPNTRTVRVKDEQTDRIVSNIYAAANPDKLGSFINDLLVIGAGIYVSRGIASLRNADGWNFINTQGLQIIGPFPSTEKLKNISELTAIQRLFDRVGGNPNLTIENLVKAAGASKGLSNTSYHFIGLNPVTQISPGPKFNKSYDIASLIQKNICTFNAVNIDNTTATEPEQYLVFTKDAFKIINDIENVCYTAWNYSFEESYPNLSIKYKYESISDRRDAKRRDQQGEAPPNSTSEIQDDSQFLSIRHLPSSIKTSSKIELDFYEGSIGEVDRLMNQLDLYAVEQEGPFYEATASYYRPPRRSDVDVLKGLSSISASFSEAGSSTTISYSTRKYQNIDRSFLSQLGSSSIGGPIASNAAAWMLNTNQA